MIKGSKFDIKAATFPDQFVSKNERDSLEFGLQVGQSIQYEWFRADKGTRSRFYNRWGYFHENRLYSRGEQPESKYKKEIAVNGDLSWINIDWRIIKVVPKFVDIVVNGMMDRLMKPKATGQDAKSQKKRKDFQDLVEGEMVSRDFLENIQEKAGVNPFVLDQEEIPRNEEELSIYLEMNYKMAEEIAEETAIRSILKENEYQETLRRVYRDLVDVGIGIVKHNFWPGFGVKTEYVDPANVVYSYTERPDMKDCFYWGEVKTIPLVDITEIDPNITPNELEEISSYSQSWWDYNQLSNYYEDSLFSKDTATLLYFNYKTYKKDVYKVKKASTGNDRAIPKDETFNPPGEMMDERDFDKVEKMMETWYEGVMVLGTNIILRWEEMKNMVRPESMSQHATSSYIGYVPNIYKGEPDPLVGRMKTSADNCQIAHLKLQQIAARVVPDGIYIDADGLNEINLGDGKAYNPAEAVNMYFQTGSVVGRSFTRDGEFNHAKVPVQQLNSSAGINKIETMIGLFNHYLEQIRLTTGLNEARDGSDPDPRALVGVQKLAALNSNTATRHILDAGIFITERLCKAISLRIADILEYAPFRDAFINRIGAENVSLLEPMSNLNLYDFGINIEVSPDIEEQNNLKERIRIALEKGDINLEDSIEVENIENIKLATQLLKMKRIRKQEHEDKMAMQQQEMQMQTQMQSQQMAAQASLQKIEAESNSKIKVKQAETAFEIEKLRAEAELKSGLMEEEFLYNLKLNGLQVDGQMKREKYKEDEKARRIDRQSSQQSALIEQRQKNLPPKNFESNVDSLDGLSNEEFEPR